ncbi:MAG: ClpXP protease specificity-enhancing factor SspB [Myxococcota bacterium]
MAKTLTDGKHTILEQLLSRHDVVQIVLDARHAGVQVPAAMASDFQLRLNLSWHFGLPMDIVPEAVTATLTFQGMRERVHVPFSAVYVMMPQGTSDARLFREDLPPELQAIVADDEPSTPQRGRTPLRVIDNAEQDATTDRDPPRPARRKAARHLRLVK